MNHPARPSRLPPAIPALACAAAVALLAGTASAQDRAERIEAAERVLPRVGVAERAVTPTRSRAAEPVRPGLTGGHDWADAAGLRPAGLSEGSFLLDRPGRVVPAPAGRLIFVPNEEGRVAGEGPMLILPSASLERMELALTNRGEHPGVRVSGEVFVYHGRSHLLVTSYAVGAAEAPTESDIETANADQPAPDATEPAEQPAEEPADEPERPSLLDDPDVRGLLEELEAARPAGHDADRARAVHAERQTAAEATGAPPAPDGTPLLRRRGRMVRTGEGAWAFVFDNDHDDPLAGQALVVLPCRLLERMERQALVSGDAFQLVVSGRVHTHDGQTYLLPTMMQHVPVTGVVPMQ